MHIKQLCMSRLNTMVKEYAIGSWKPVHASINLEILDTNKRSLHLPTTYIYALLFLYRYVTRSLHFVSLLAKWCIGNSKESFKKYV